MSVNPHLEALLKSLGRLMSLLETWRTSRIVSSNTNLRNLTLPWTISGTKLFKRNSNRSIRHSEGCNKLMKRRMHSKLLEISSSMRMKSFNILKRRNRKTVNVDKKNQKNVNLSKRNQRSNKISRRSQKRNKFRKRSQKNVRLSKRNLRSVNLLSGHH